MAKIVSWNVNGLRAAVRNGFLQWLGKCRADVVCVQELRALPEQLDESILRPKGYKPLWQPAQRKGYSGVAAFVKKEPLSVDVMGVEEFDVEGRVQVLEYAAFTIVNAYYPNSQPERARIDYKLAFCDAMAALCNRLRDEGRNVILCGDYNIAHTEIDLARPKQNEDNPGYLPEERAAMTAFLAEGYMDTFRHFTPDSGNYTWWSYRGRAREKNVGWRLDYHCVNEAFLPQVRKSVILSQVTGSDHCPVMLTVK